MGLRPDFCSLVMGRPVGRGVGLFGYGTSSRTRGGSVVYPSGATVTM